MDKIQIDSTSHVLVVGSGITGSSVAKFFYAKKIKCHVIDENKIKDTKKMELVDFAENRKDLITVEERFLPTKENLERIKSSNFTFAVTSPGIDPKGKLIQSLKKIGLPIITEPELAFSYLGMPLIAVTGSNGKTTTVNIIYKMLQESNICSSLGGNIGKTLISLVSDNQQEIPQALLTQTLANPSLVVELSSYQLEEIKNFKPKISVWLNLNPNHLERHINFENYLLAKANILTSQDENDFSIINKDDPSSLEIQKHCKGKILFFGMEDDASKSLEGAFLDEAKREIVLRLNGETETYLVTKSHLRGIHNRLNLAAAILASKLAGVKKESIENVIESFLPVEHRIEFVTEKNQVIYINDSKSTNLTALLAALNACFADFIDRKIILLIGGQMKVGSWEPLKELLNPPIRDIIFFGADGRNIIEALGLTETVEDLQQSSKNQFGVSYFTRIEEALSFVKIISAPQDLVLFSPACASFDAFSNFEERGRFFKDFVEKI